MKQFDDKEKRFKDILGGFSLDIDSQEIWEAVEDKLPVAPQKKSKPFWFWKRGVVSVLALGLLSFISYNIVSDDSQNTSISDSYISESNTIFGSTKAYEAAIDAVFESQSKEAPIVKALSRSNEELSNVSNEEPIATRIAESAAPIKSNLTSYNKQQVQNQNVIVQRVPKNTESINIQSTTGQSQQLLTSTSATLLNTKAQKLYTLAIVPQLESRAYFLAKQPRNIQQNLSFATPIVDIQEKVAKWDRFYTLASGFNINHTDYTMTELGQGESKSQFGYESGLMGIASGLIMGVESEEGYRMFGGLNYHYTASHYSNHDLVLTVDTRPGVESFHIDGAGNIVEQEGGVTVVSESQLDIDWYNENHLIDLILGVGKVWFNQNGYELSFDLGLNYNLISRSTGYAFNESGTGIDKFDYGEENSYKRNRGFGTTLRANFSKTISDHLQISVTPFYNHYFNNIYTNSSFTAKNSQVGLQLGITFSPGWE